MGLFNLGYKQLLNSFLMTKMNLWTLFYKLKRFFGPMAHGMTSVTDILVSTSKEDVTLY